VRVAKLFLVCSGFAAAQSHPSWWNNASPKATGLVGIEWQSIQNTPVAEALQSELWGSMGFPDLPCVHHARQIVISSPELLALVSGNCATIQDQARAFKPMNYRGVEMYFAREKGTLSVAKLNDQLVMIGETETLQLAVDRTLATAKEYSPLLAKAAQFNGRDFWIVSSQLPDDLANRFLPMSVTAQRFEGFVSFRAGLELHVLVTSTSEQQAQETAAKLQKDMAGLPAIFRQMEVTTESESVVLSLSATKDQVTASMRAAESAEPAPKPVETIKVETPKHVEYVPVELPKAEAPKVLAAKPAEKPLEKSPEPVPVKPQTVRIVGLDEGPKEIVLPPPVKQNP
jgi:hypothetical protein